MTATRDYRQMTIEELNSEWEAWEGVFRQPKGPGSPSNAARETALRHMNEIEGWIARREMEARNV